MTYLRNLMVAAVGMFAIGLFAYTAAAQQPAAMATLPPGTIFYNFSTAIARVAAQQGDYRLAIQPYNGTHAGVVAVTARDADFVLLDVNEAIVAVNGRANFSDQAHPNLRIVGRLVPISIGLLVRADSDIETIDDLKGRRVPSGWRAFPNGEALTYGMMRAGDVDWDDVKPVPTASLLPALNQFVAGRVDVTMFSAASPKVHEAAQTVGGIRYLNVPDDPAALARMRKVRPAYYVRKIDPAPHLAGISKPTNMLIFDVVVVAGEHASDEAVYRLAKVLHANKPALVAAFKPLAGFDPAQMSKSYPEVAYHPGAIRFYREMGMWRDK